MDKVEKYIIKVPTGTVVKVEGHPVQLKSSLYIEKDSTEFKLEEHKILEADDEPQPRPET